MHGYPKFFQSPENHLKAAWGTFLIALFSVVPLLALPLIDALRRAAMPVTATPPDPITGWDTISSGQMFMYSFALFGSLFWMLLQEYKDGKGIPYKSAYMAILVLICGYCAMVYSISPELKYDLPAWAVVSSLGCFVVFTVLHYIFMVYPSLPAPSLHDNMRGETLEIINTVRAARKKK